MFRHFFFLGLVSGAASSAACYVYTSFYYNLLVDFSEGTGLPLLISACFGIAMIACFGNYALRRVIKRPGLADFVLNALFSLVSIMAVFILLNAKDPEFKNEDAALFVDFFKGFVMPMLFFPALTWFTFKPLIVRS